MYWGNVERARLDKTEKLAEIDQEIAALYDLHPNELSGLPRGSDPGDPTMAAAMKADRRKAVLSSIKARLEEDLKEINRRAAMIEYEVMCLPPLESEVIRLRYVVYGVSKKGYWQRIARKVHVCEDHAKKLERKGVDRLMSVMKVDTIGHD